MTDAQRTVELAVFNGIIDQWHKKNDSNFAELIKAKVMENLFAPHLMWAVKEYIEEIEKKA